MKEGEEQLLDRVVSGLFDKDEEIDVGRGAGLNQRTVGPASC